MKSGEYLQEIGIDSLILLKMFLKEFVVGFILGSSAS
jgi:hypothetical protein